MSTSKSLVEKRVSVQLKAGLDKLLHLNNEDMLSSAIDRQNKQDFEQQKAKYQCKVLLLGAGDSGKSTIVKQLKVLHGGGFEEGELRHWAIKIHENMSSSMATIITLAKREEALKDDEQKVLLV